MACCGRSAVKPGQPSGNITNNVNSVNVPAGTSKLDKAQIFQSAGIQKAPQAPVETKRTQV